MNVTEIPLQNTCWIKMRRIFHKGFQPIVKGIKQIKVAGLLEPGGKGEGNPPPTPTFWKTSNPYLNQGSRFITIKLSLPPPIFRPSYGPVTSTCRKSHNDQRNGLRPSLDMNSIIFSAGFLMLLPNRFTATGTRARSIQL